MAVLQWDPSSGTWQGVDDRDAPEGLGGAEVGLYETMRATASAYAHALHEDRIAASWERLTGRAFPAASVPSLADACAEVRRHGWPALRFEVRKFAGDEPVAQLRRRERPAFAPPVRLLPIAGDEKDSAYPHKSVERGHLRRALDRAIAAGADDALFVVGGEVRETAQAFLGFFVDDALILPPLREDVLPSTTRTTVAAWCREVGRAVVERPIGVGELDGGALLYGNAVIGLLPARVIDRAAVPLPDWFDAEAIDRRL